MMAFCGSTGWRYLRLLALLATSIQVAIGQNVTTSSVSTTQTGSVGVQTTTPSTPADVSTIFRKDTTSSHGIMTSSLAHTMPPHEHMTPTHQNVTSPHDGGHMSHNTTSHDHMVTDGGMPGGSHDHNMTVDGKMPDDHKDHDSGMHPAEHGDGNSSSHHSVAYFFLSTEATILFEQWVASSLATFIISCVVVAVVAFLYEGIKLLRDVVRVKQRQYHYYAKHFTWDRQTGCTYCNKKSVGLHFVQVFLHMLQTFLSYCLMMVFMLFNGWLCIAIIVGTGVGYLLFGWKKSVIAAEEEDDHCH